MHWAACIRIAAYTGLRAGELRALRWEQVDWAASVVHVRRNAPVHFDLTDREGMSVLERYELERLVEPAAEDLAEHP